MKLAKKAFVLVVLLTLQLTCFCLCSAQAATLTLPAELQEIEAGAFYGATMLDEVALPSGIQRIGSLAFANSSLTKINLPESLDYIADDAFLRTNLETVTVEAGTYACDWAVAHGYIAVPSAPKQNAPTPSGNSITVSWSPAKGATSYTVYYGKSSYFSNAEPIIAGDVTSTTINNLAYKTTYYTWVTASNAAGESKQSSRMYVTTPEELPEVPVQNAPTVSGNKITVSWSKAERATSYKVYYGTSESIADATAVSGGSGTSKAITGLKYDTTYYIWVKAINSAGESGESAREKITTPEAIPTAPVQNELTASGNSITVSWNPVAGAKSYTVYYGTNINFSNAQSIIAGDVTSTTINNLAYKKTYYTWVTATNSAGESDASNRKNIATQEELPDAPVQNAPTVSGNKITVSWSKAERATSYKVYYGTSKNIADATAVSGGSGTSKTITGLEYDTTYYIWVKAINSAGESSESAREKITTPEAIPTAPVQNELTASGNSITVSWNPVEGATSYTVYYGTSTYVSNAQSIIAGDVTSTTINNLAYKKTYYTWVTATNSAGESDKSNRKNIATQEELPDAPVQNAPTASGNSITVSWSKAAGATSYTVYYNTSDSITDAEAVSAGSTTSKTITGLEYEKTYYIWVTASNSAGESEKSNSEIITTGGPAIDISSVQLTETSVTLEVGETHTLTASPIPSNASVKSTTWSSSKTSVAKVSSTGIITAVAEGTATITAKMTSSEGTVKTATCTVNVIPTVIDITGVQLNKTSVTLKVGETDTLIASPIPSNASVKSTTWSSNKTSVAKVSSTGKITAVAEGTATITATMTSSEGTVKTATCLVTVIPTPIQLSAPTGFDFTGIAQNAVSVSFDAVSGASGYYVYYSTNSTFKQTYSKVSASYSNGAWRVYIDGLASGTRYYFWAAAYDSSGNVGETSRITTYTLSTTVSLSNRDSGQPYDADTIYDFNISDILYLAWNLTNSYDNKIIVNAYVMTSETKFDAKDSEAAAHYFYINQEYTSSALSESNGAVPFGDIAAHASAGQYVKIWLGTRDKNYDVNGQLVGVQFALRLTNPAPVTVKTSIRGINFIKSWEGCSLEVYDDGAGNATIGWGHRIQAGESFTTITQEEADALFLQDLAKKEAITNEFISKTGIEPTWYQYDALSSFFYNGNSGALSSSTSFYKMFYNNRTNLGGVDPKEVYRRFAAYCNPGSSVQQGLFRRRCDEARIFLNGVYSRYTWTIPGWVKNGQSIDESWYPVELGTNIDITAVQLNKTSVTLKVGETDTLTASPYPSTATVTTTTAWSSSKTSVAKVSSTGKITAVAEGTATITATMTSSEGTVKTATCTVNVIPSVIDITGVQLNKTSVTLKVGETDTLTASPKPSNASVKSTTWSSNKTSVAKVSSTGKITAVAKGTATITATMTSSEGTVKTATCTVTVVPDQVKFLTTPNVTGGQCAGDEYTVEFDTTTNAYYVVVCYKDSSGTHEKADKFYASQYGTAYSSKISWKFKYNFESTGNSDTRTVILRCYDASGKCDTETSNEFTCKPEGPVFTVNLPDMTVRIGESPIINATVSVSGGSGYVGWVIMAAYGYSDSGMSDNFSGHNKSSITTGGYAAYRIDTSKAPWNTPGTYTVRLWVTDSNGNGPTTGTDADGASASMTVIITPASNDLTAKINKARSLFTDGKYWCHTPGASFTRYTLSNTACTCIYRHGQSRQGAGSHPVLDGSCGCNYYYGIQCFGYANAIANEVFGSPAEDANGNAMSNWTKVSGSSHVNELKVGDVIRIDPGHSAFITKVTESTIYVTQCNWTVNDKIEWDYAFSKTSLSASGSYTLRYYLRHSSMK